MMRSKIRIVHQAHPVQLAINANDLLPSLGHIKIDMVLIVAFIRIGKGRTGDIIRRGKLPGQLSRYCQALLVQ